MFRKMLALFLVCGLLGLTTGCPSKDEKTKTKDKEKTKGTAAKKEKDSTSAKQDQGPAEKKQTLNVTAPDDFTIKAGEKDKALVIKIEAKELKDPIKVKLTGLPTGVTADKDEQEVAKEGGDATFKLSATDAAKPDDKAKPKVTATSGELKKEADLNIKVEKKG
jgi:hypothetical protein